MRSKSRLTAAQLTAISALLLLIFLIRAHNSLALPAFNDESLHIRRSEIVWTFDNPATSFTVGKLLGYYWLGAFGFDRLDVLHGGRLVYALFILIGAAGAYRVGRSLFSHGVGLLALLLYAFAPYLIFYERMILADQLAASLGMLVIWAGIRLARHPTRQNGLLSGVFITLAVLAKLTAIPFALVPLAAIVILGKRETGSHPPETLHAEGFRARASRIIPRRTWPALITCYGFNLLTGLPFMLFPLFREVSREPVLVVGTDLFVSSGWDRVFAENVPRLWDVLRVYFGLGAVLLALLLIARLWGRSRREALYLIVCTLLPWSLILPLSPDPSNRYWLPGIPPLLVLVAAGLSPIYPLGRRFGAKTDQMVGVGAGF
jgi:4-amino-4-deoxy-L-arabinose transferase-like glycosyltransferase